MKPLCSLCAAVAFLCAGLVASAQQSSSSPSAMSANFCLIKMFGTNNCTARCEVKILNDSFKESSTEGFALLDGKMRQEMDISQYKAQMFPPAAVRQMGIDQQVIILRPDLKLAYNIYPRLKSYVIRPLPTNDAAAQGKEPVMAVTELGPEKVDGHPCVKKNFVVTTGDGGKHEILAWLASDLKGFPVKTQVADEDNIEVTTYKDIRFIAPDAKLFEPPAGFTRYADFEEMMDKTQTNGAVALSDTNAATAAEDGRFASIIAYTLKNGTNRPVNPATAKAFGLGDEKIPATQLILSRKEDALVHFFGISDLNSNDVFVALIDRTTRTGTVWLTSPSGVIRATLLTSTNTGPKVVANDRYANVFSEEIDMFYGFTTPPWEDAPHPLNVVAKFGALPEVEKILKGNKKAINRQDDEGMTPLACAVVQEQTDVVRYLLSQGADPNIPDKNGDTPLGLAASRNKTNGTPLCELLLAKGAEVNPTNNKSEFNIPPLSWAVSSDNTELVKILLAHGADPNARGGNILRSAASRGDTEIVALLLDHGANLKALSDGMTPLHDAAEGGRDEVVKLLLSKGAGVNARRYDGATPLMSAADREHKTTVEILLAAGADINAVDDKGNTPLHWAVARENKEVVEILLAHGADLKSKNKEGQTPMQFAVRWHQPPMAEFLRQHGAKE